MYHYTMGTLLERLGVKNYPAWMVGTLIRDDPMPHQTAMMRLYLHYLRYGDFAAAGAGKTFPAHFHGILMAGLGNKVVYTMPPKLIDQFHEEMLSWFRGVEKNLDIQEFYGTKAQKDRKLEEWERNGWPDILMLSYDGYRELNDVHKEKKVGSNQWYTADGTRITDPQWRGEKFTKDGRPINRRGMAKNNKHRLLTRAGYNVFFFDEAHALCGLDSIISKSVEASLQSDEAAIYLMTGTPVPTVISDAYGIIRLINPDAYVSQSSFERQHVIKKPMNIRVKGRTRTIKVPTSYVNTEKIHRELFRYARRIEKRDVVKLKDPLITDVKVRLTGKHAQLYKKFMRDHFAIVGNTVLSPESQQEARHMSLKLISCPSVYDPSIPMENNLWDRFHELMNEIDPMLHKVVVFAYNRATVEFLVKKCAELGWNPACIYGGSGKGEDTKFKTDDSCRVIVLNWLSGGAGLNLQCASHVIFYENPNPTHAKQGIARVDRKGQTETVNVYFMRVMNTLSDKSYKKMLRSEESINQTVKDEHDLLYQVLGEK